VEETLEVPVLLDVCADDEDMLAEDEHLRQLAEELREAIRRKVAPRE
jgi:hypothetical protein